MSKLNLAFVGELPPLKSGIGSHNEDLLRALTEDERINLHCYIRQSRVISIPKVSIINLPFAFNKQHLLSKRMDVFHFQWGNTAEGSYVERAFDFLRDEEIAKVSTLHGPVGGISNIVRIMLTNPTRIFYKTSRIKIPDILENSNKVIVYSTAYKKHLLDNNLNISQDKITVIPHGVNVKSLNSALSRDDAREKLFIGNNKFIIASFGYLTPRKGYEEVISAIKKLKEDGISVEYHILGKYNFPHYRVKLFHLTRKLGIEDNIFFHGYIRREELPLYLRAADLIIQPRKYEASGASGSLVQTIASGTPVIASVNIIGVSEYISEKTAILVNHREESYYDAIRLIYLDRTKAKRVSENAIRWCQQNIDWKIIAKKHSELWKELLEGKK